jgi:plastocyanin domain-containing protein
MKWTVISIIVAGVLVIGAMFFNNQEQTVVLDNVKIEDGVQVVEIEARGGYSPRVSSAQAGMDTVIRMRTRGTFDCSIALVLPSVGYRNTLPNTAEIDIPIGAQEAGTVFRGLCSMGMYNFSVNFN